MIRYWIVVILLLPMLPQFAAAEGARPPIVGTTLVAPLMVDGTRYFSSWIFPNAKRASFFVEAAPLLETLTDFIKEEPLEQIRRGVNKKRVISLAALDLIGIKASFDEQSLDLILSIQDSLRKQSIANVNGLAMPSYRNVAENALFSGYLNARATQNYIYPHLEAQKSRQPLKATFDLINNVGGVVLETGEDYTERNGVLWRRKDSRIIVDNEKNMNRYTLGDLQPHFVGYQQSISMAGLEVSRQFSIQPYTVTRPLNATEMFLRRPSQVEVYVNGVFATRLRLQAGPINIRDFPLANGLNNVELKITDDLGKTETVQLSLLYDSQLLREGYHEFAYSVGAPGSETIRDRKYDSHNITNTAFHRVGVSQRLTVGANFQSNEGQRLAGLDKVWISRLGLISSDLAAGWEKGDKALWAGRMRFKSLEYYGGELQLTRFSLESEYKDVRFGAINTLAPQNLYSWLLDGYAVRVLPYQLSGGIGYRHELARANLSDRSTWRADLSKNWSSSWRSGVNYSYSRGPLTEHRVLATVTWTDSAGRYYANATYDYPTDTKRIDVTRNTTSAYNDVRVAAGVQDAPTARQADLQAEFIGARGTARVDHQSIDPAEGSNFHQSALTLSSAIAWTDSAVALSRPITESFVILPVKKYLKRFNIPINNNGDYPEAEANSWGPAVLPSVISYSFSPISIDASALPVGYSVGREFWAVKPTYKSGVSILIGGDASLIASGALTEKGGHALALVAGEVYDAKGRATGQSFFTNRRGQYMIENLKPGRYQMRFLDPQYKSVWINAQGEVGIVQVGTQQVTKVQD